MQYSVTCYLTYVINVKIQNLSVYFLHENLRQLIYLLVVLRLDEHILALPVYGLIITTSVLQYSNIL